MHKLVFVAYLLDLISTSKLIIHVILCEKKLVDIFLLGVIGWITWHYSVRSLSSEMIIKLICKEHKSENGLGKVYVSQT